MSSCESTGSSPVVKEFEEKKRSLRRIASEVGSMTSQLQEVRKRVVAQEASLAQEAANRQAAESKAKSMEMEVEQLQQRLESKSSEAQSSAASVGKQYIEELEDVRLKLSKVQASADASEASIHLAESRFSQFLTELDEKNKLLEEHGRQVTRLGKQVAELNEDLKTRENSQRHQREEVLKLEQEIKFAINKADFNKQCELGRILEEVSAKNIENLSRHLSRNDEEIVSLREEVKILSSQLKHKTQELEAQLEKQQRADQDLKKRVLKLEFSLQETRSQTRKLQRMAERRDRELKELTVKALTRVNDGDSTVKLKFWEKSRFKYVVSLTMVILVVFAKK